MKIYNLDKTKELIENECDIKKGCFFEDKLTIHHEEQQFIQKISHYEVIKEYENGGKDVEEIVDQEGQEYKPAYDEEVDILVYKPYTEEELTNIELNELRARREVECFSFINRGELWYKQLTKEQLEELNKWYNDWLNAPETKVIPIKPTWLK